MFPLVDEESVAGTKKPACGGQAGQYREVGASTRCLESRRVRGIKKECLKFIEKSDDLNVDMLTSSELACMKVNQQPFVP